MACKSGCAAEIKALEQAIGTLLAFRQRIKALLENKRPADVHDLLSPRELRGSFHNLVITYFDFPTWLYRFDEDLTRGLDVNIHSYRYQRNRHLDEVSILLAKYLGKDTGQALKNAIVGAGHDLLVYPYFSFALYPKAPWRPLGLNATAHAAGFEQDVKGSNSIIMFTPHMWGKDGKRGTFGYAGPGSDADEVLFHEMIHGVRQMTGVSTDNKLGNGYDNEEEFVAVVVSNIYLAEKKKNELRASHDGFAVLARPDDFLKTPLHRQLLRKFRAAQPDLFEELADIPERKAWWNPVRELRDAER
jgi:hypothetical protein